MATDSPLALECGCGRCSFDDCLAKRIAAKIPAWTHPGTLGCLSFIREISAGAGVPGLRSASGALLTIVDQVASMQDCKLDFTILMQDCIDNTAVVATAVQTAKECEDSQGIKIPQSFHAHTQKFSDVLTAIAKVVKRLLQRGWFIRFIFGKADRDEIVRLRQKMDQEIQNFGLFMLTENYIKMLGLQPRESSQGASTSSPTQGKPVPKQNMKVDPKLVKDFSQKVGKHRIARLEGTHVAQVSSRNTITTNTTAPITTHGDNSSVHVINSYQNNNHSVQNSGNDYSRNTNTYNSMSLFLVALLKRKLIGGPVHGPNSTINNSRRYFWLGDHEGGEKKKGRGGEESIMSFIRTLRQIGASNVGYGFER
ncbi:hypothetical protein BKA70DRAFT_1459824 [Coprinopsis sp. MPI-PUGE-AT-0042]|nr:hypothetical protein BKA70DRAFT_1459824 [Coprinopsis sp. MPI-PUGE-AT-0042]